MWQSEGVVLAEMDLGPLAAFASVDATNQLVISEFNEIELCARLSLSQFRLSVAIASPASRPSRDLGIALRYVCARVRLWCSHDFEF